MTPLNVRRTVTPKRCPSEAEILAFVDADLPPERLERVEQHLSHCGSCAKQVSALTEMIRDMAAPVSRQFDVTPHVQSVMSHLDDPPAVRYPESRRVYWMGALLAAAAVVLLLVFPVGKLTHGEFAPRGQHAKPTLARNVGVQLYVRDASLQPLTAARRISASAALTAGLRNLGQVPAYLLLFAVDAQNTVHWIAPEFTVAGSDPIAVTIPRTVDEQPLANSVVFDDLAPGTLRIVALITPKPLHVSQIESLSVSDLTEARLKQLFAGADVRETVAEVTRD